MKPLTKTPPRLQGQAANKRQDTSGHISASTSRFELILSLNHVILRHPSMKKNHLNRSFGRKENGTLAGEGSKRWRYCRYSFDTFLAWLRPWQCMNMLIKYYKTDFWIVRFLFYHHLFATCHIVFAQKNHEWVVSIDLGIVMDFTLRPRTVHSSPNDGASRQDPSL